MFTMELLATDRLSDPKRDALYNYDAASNNAIASKKPWLKDVHYFKTVRISAVALMKMVMHARSGGAFEVMGLMQGYVMDNSSGGNSNASSSIAGGTLVVTDAFRLPVIGTETRVNAQDDANEYLVEYLRLCREEGTREENVVGWYHSHPGYGCWLSGIDVSTQHLQQSFNDPFVAVVIDPDRTTSANKVEIGAFRTYPESHKAAVPTTGEASGSGSGGVVGQDGSQSVPVAKAEDFGAHASKYYALEVEHFKSTLDSRLLELLWNKYWVQTLAQNPLITNRDYASSQMADLGVRVQEVAGLVSRTGRGGGQGAAGPVSAKGIDGAMEKIVRDVNQIAAKERAGLMAADVKSKLFGGGTGNAPTCGCGKGGH
ncbi:JAB1/Mov34/MPN/PAD-1 ubiquitin protease-domain-containing protein [Lasiosphaeris hirsuta]|uniref:COP9 signalosome complex subunit 5 n=1 Tax=Lasiosphaeris hirsuta TaxID=260670 RepID=A0AA40DTJ2_9PEZI|nr:JAB1/Mov34/MPN/PAD-1 ubiquitin protease-domain-containing protein [Lasiosphaeris hirsuta]